MVQVETNVDRRCAWYRRAARHLREQINTRDLIAEAMHRLNHAYPGRGFYTDEMYVTELWADFR